MPIAPAFAILGKAESTTVWNGDALTLGQYEGASMPQTPNGSMMLAYLNRSKRNSEGKLAWTSGASAPQFLVAPALAIDPTVFVHNWGGNNLNITNVSVGADTPIQIAGYGPGIGPVPVALPIGAPGIQLAPQQAAQGVTGSGWMQLGFQLNSGDLAVFGFIGGPADPVGNNAYVIALNSPAGNTGPGTGNPPPSGYYATSSGNQWSYEFNWPSSLLYIAFFGAATIAPAPLGSDESLPTITLIRL